MNDQSHWRRYLVVWCALIGLTTLSYLAAQLQLGAWEVVIGLGIATLKATLVALFFMHLIDEHRILAMVGFVTVVWVVLLCAGIAADVGMR